jgi:hypothetical protein
MNQSDRPCNVYEDMTVDGVTKKRYGTLLAVADDDHDYWLIMDGGRPLYTILPKTRFDGPDANDSWFTSAEGARVALLKGN